MNGYNWLQFQLNSLDRSKCKIFSIGKSVLGRNIYAIQIGNGPKVLIQYGIHAREFVTAALAILHAKMLSAKKTLGICYVLIPLVNPDGAELVFSGTHLCGEYKDWLECNFSQTELLLWKANIRGVDLNNNFNANFGKNVYSLVPGPSGFPGPHPASEPESLSLVKFTEQFSPCFTISFHTKGEEVYFDFFQSHRNRIRDFKIAQLFAQDFGYKIKSTQNVSSGGFKDWCVSVLGIPSLTIELASDSLSHPIPCDFAQELLVKTKNLHNLCIRSVNILMRYNKDAT